VTSLVLAILFILVAQMVQWSQCVHTPEINLDCISGPTSICVESGATSVR